VDGEILVADELLGGEEAAAHLLECHGRTGIELRVPSGQFAAALWDEDAGVLVLVTDRLGTRPLYVSRTESLILAGSEQKALLAAGADRRLDLDGAAQLLAYEHLLGERTLSAGIRLLPPATTTVVGMNSERRVDRGAYRVAPADAVDVEECVDGFGRLLEVAVLRRRDHRTALALSGGLDSRCLAMIVGGRWPGSRAFVFGSPGTEEIERASAVARLCGLDRALIELEHGYVARDAAETVWLTEGQIRCFHSHHLGLRSLRRDHGITSLLVGYAGDVVVRTTSLASAVDRPRRIELVDAVHERLAVALDDDALARVLTRRFADELRDRAREGLSLVLGNLDGPDVARVLDFGVQESYRRKVLPGAELYVDDVLHRDPYVDDQLLDFLARVPVALRLGHTLQVAYIRRVPALARVPNPKTGVAPALEGLRLAIARGAVRVRRSARSRADHTLRRAGLPPRSGYSDYAGHLRGPSASKVLGLLLDERTLDRGQIHAPGVRDLVEKTVSGHAAHTQVLGVLLTLELFQRQFVDGDGYTQPRTGPDDVPAHLGAA
jgi:asparagine synthetase B (glutamine-hydrolysing)